MTAACSAQAGATGHCLAGRHQQCAYNPDGSCAQGVWLPECYVTTPRGVVVSTVVHPSHRYTCPCNCHTTVPVGQLELFAAIA